MSASRKGCRVLFAAVVALVAATCSSLTDANRSERTVMVVLANESLSGAVPPPFVSVVDSVHLVVTSQTGATLFTGGQRLQRHQTSVSLPVELSGSDAATFKAQVLSLNRSVLFEGETTANLLPNDFTVVVQIPAKRPVLLATPDTARAVFDSAVTWGSLAIHNRGRDSLVWSVVPDAAFTQCGRLCRVTPSSGTILAGRSDTMRISIPSVPPFSSRVFSFVLRSAEGDVAVQWQLSALPVAAVAVSSTDVLLQVKQSEQLASTVQVNGTVSKAVVWSTSNRNVAIVSTAGVATGLSPGLATITAVSAVDSTKRATALVRVFDPSQQLPFAWRVTDPVRPVVVRREDNVPGVHSVTLQATAQAPVGQGLTTPVFPNPMSSRVEFWVQRPGAPWRLVGQTSSPPPNNPVPGGWSFSTVWNPDATSAPFPNPSSNRLNLIAIGITANFAVYPTPPDTSITVTVP